jgi:hypothetical protein
VPNNLDKAKPTFPTSLTFIDARDSDARRKARSHVMREFMRHKRWEEDTAVDPRARNNLRDTLVLRSQSPSPDSSLASLGILIPLNQDSSEDESFIPLDARQSPENENNSLAQQDTERRRQEEDNAFDETALRMLVRRHSNPDSSFSASRSDPFSSLPIKILEKDRVLVDHCLSILLHLRLRPEMSLR